MPHPHSGLPFFSANPNPATDKRGMERRRHPRLPVQGNASARILSGPQRSLAMVLDELSPAGARLRSSEPLAPGTLLRVECAETLLLGEIVHCQKLEDGYLAGMSIEHSLTGITDLHRLMDALLAELPERDQGTHSPSVPPLSSSQE
jgi:hypothetical protein